MITEWSTETLSRKPEAFQKLNENIYIQRRNIQKIEEDIPNSTDKSIYYTCECRKLDKSTYESFINMLESPTQEELVSKIKNVQNTQTNSDENTTALMLGVVDLYEKLDNLIEAVNRILPT